MTTTRCLLERIATTLNVPSTYFFHAEAWSTDSSAPSPAQCEEVASLFRAITSPTRRGTVLKLLRAMAADA